MPGIKHRWLIAVHPSLCVPSRNKPTESWQPSAVPLQAGAAGYHRDLLLPGASSPRQSEARLLHPGLSPPTLDKTQVHHTLKARRTTEEQKAEEEPASYT